MLATVEASGALGNLANHAGVTPNFVPVFTHQAVTPTIQDDTWHQLVKNTSHMSLFTAGVQTPSSNMARTSSFVERAQRALSVSMFHRGTTDPEPLMAEEWSMDTIIITAILMGSFIWTVVTCSYCFLYVCPSRGDGDG